MNLSKLFVPMVAGLAMTAGVSVVYAQTSGTDGTSAPTQNRSTMGTTDGNGMRNDGSTTLDNTTPNNNSNNMNTPVTGTNTNPSVNMDDSSDEQLVARADRN